MSEFVARQVFRFFRAWGMFLNCVVLECVFLGVISGGGRGWSIILLLITKNISFRHSIKAWQERL